LERRERTPETSKEARFHPELEILLMSNETATELAPRRGRPPGSKNKPKIADGAIAELPKRRGRPPGSTNKPKIADGAIAELPKRRGRPPGSTNKPKIADGAIAELPKRRGRPPGSKNKSNVGDPTATKAAKPVSGGTSMMDALLDYMKAKPNAVFAEAKAAMASAGHTLFPVSWGRAQLLLGRVTKSVEKVAKAAKPIAEVAPPTVSSVEAPVKRGRGRPRKVVAETTASAPVRVVSRATGGTSIPVAASDVGTIQAFVDAANAGGRIELRYAHGAWSLTVAS